MSKLIIYVTGRTLFHGFARGPFKWHKPTGLYRYEGREFSEAEFNKIVDKVLHDYSDMNPSVRITEFSSTAPAIPEPVAQIHNGHEVSLYDALSVVERLAPEKLKRKTGPRPQRFAEAV
jgi:hypothetical protein